MVTLTDPGSPLESRSPSPPGGGPAAEAMRSRVAARLFGEAGEPSRIGRFEVRDTLGAGGMGVVYLAKDPTLDRAVALKLVSQDRVLDERQRGRLVQEARALARLSHPNVVTIHEVGEHVGGIFIVMERIDGIALSEWQQAAPRSTADVLDVYRQAAAGLQAAHEAGIVHRDFKPSNVLVGRDGRVRVADFGLARLTSSSVSDGEADTTSGGPPDLTKSAIMGTPAYMSPEQAAGRATDARSDQFSFCVALWEAIFGTRPWEPIQVRAMAVDRSTIAPPAIRREGPRWLRRVLLRGLAPEPAARWPSLAIVARRLSTGQRHRRYTWGLGGVAAAALLLLALPSVESQCGDPSDALDGLWDDARRRALEDQASASRVAFEPRALESLARRLDVYATSWIDARKATCEATFVRHDQSEEQFDRSVACLDRARWALGAVVDTFVGATPEVVASADLVLAQLPVVEACRDTRVLRDGSDPPPPGVFAEVEDARRSVDRVAVLSAAGRTEAALELASSVRDRAIRIGYTPTIAEATYAFGYALSLRGDISASREALFEAATMALGAREHRLAARAWHRLARLAAVDLEDLPHAREWQALAASELELVGESEALLAEHLDHEGLIARVAQDYDAAAEFHRRAAELLGRTLPVDDLHVLEIERNQASALLMAGKLDDAERIYRSIDDRVVARLGDRHPERARILHNLALIAGARGDASAAKRGFETSLEILTAAFGPTSLRVAPVLTALGQLAMQAGEWDDALEHGARAWEIQRTQLPVGHSERASGLVLLAETNRLRGAHEDAIARYRELVMEFSQGANEDQLPLLHQNIAFELCQLGRYGEAREPAEVARLLVPEDSPVRLHAEQLLARIDLEQGQTDRAIAELERILPLADRLPSDAHAQLLVATRVALARALRRRSSTGDGVRAAALLDEAHERAVASDSEVEVRDQIEALRRTSRRAAD